VGLFIVIGHATAQGNVAPTVSLTAPASWSSFLAPATVNLSATASDSDGTITKVEFYRDTTLINTDTIAPYAYTDPNVGMGTYSYTAMAYDNNGGITTSAPVMVVSYIPPTISLTAPTNNAVFAAPANITINATVTGGAGYTEKVRFYAGTTQLNLDMAPPYTFNWTNVPAGTYTLTATVTLVNGVMASSAPITVTVTVTAGASTVHYIHTDHLNTPRAITNQAAATVWKWENTEPFGNNVPIENPSGLGNFV